MRGLSTGLPKQLKNWSSEKAVGSSSLQDLGQETSEATGSLVDGAGGGRGQDHRRPHATSRSRKTFSSTAATPTMSTTSGEPRNLRRRQIHYVDVGTSGGVWGLERGYCMMIGGESSVVKHLDPILGRSRPACGDVPRTPGREKLGGTAEQGYLHCGPEWRRPLRQDGPQRHRVRPDGGLRRGHRHSAQRQHRQAAARRSTPRRRRCATPSTTNTTSNLRDIAEVWRRGSVIASWLLDLTASALVEDPRSQKFAGRVSDSGEGRWTIKAAIDEAVPSRFSPPRSMNASPRAVKRTIRTSCCRRCDLASAGTSRSPRK